MRYLKLTSNTDNPNSQDIINLNAEYFDNNGNRSSYFTALNGFLCTQFQTLGISRKHETLQIENRQFSVNNKMEFKKYTLSIEILSQYSQYDTYYNTLITFIDRNKKDGLRLYYRPNDKREIRYCLCDIVSLEKTEKLQPIKLTLQQNSLWFGQTKHNNIVSEEQTINNAFEFKKDDDGLIYCAGFYNDSVNTDIYSINFIENYFENSIIINNCYNKIPLQIYVNGYCNTPHIILCDKDNVIIKEIKVDVVIEKGYSLYINSKINENGVWIIYTETGAKIEDVTDKVNNDYGSPYWYIDNGTYYVKILQTDTLQTCNVLYNEEYNE